MFLPNACLANVYRLGIVDEFSPIMPIRPFLVSTKRKKCNFKLYNSLFNQSHFHPQSVQNPPFCTLPNNLFNSTRFSDRDSGVNSQENLSEVFPESSLGPSCDPNNITGPKTDFDWLNLEQDTFSLI